MILYIASLDIILNFNAWKNFKFSQILRYLLKFAVAAMWAVLLPIAYSKSVQRPTGVVKFFSTWTGDWKDQSFYTYAVLFYVLPNILAALLFLVPPFRRAMECSDMRIIKVIMWWAQASIKLFFWFLSILVFTFLFLFVTSVSLCFFHLVAKTICWKRYAWGHVLSLQVSDHDISCHH